MEQFRADLDSGRFAKVIDVDQALGTKAGVRGTPAFFINGRFLSGAQPFEKFDTLIQQELKRAQKLLDQGISPEGLYQALTQSEASPAGPPAP